jgi:glycosyltransferase involved in cell wall biosynthesis
LEKFKPLVSPSYSLSLADQLPNHVNDYAWMEMTAFKLARVIQKRQPSVILAEDSYSSLIVLLARKHIPPAIKVIVSVWCFLSGMLSLDKKHGELRAFLTQKLFNNADRVIANNKGISQDLVENFNVHPEKIVTLFNTFNFERVRKLSDEAVTEHIWFAEDIPIVLFVGRLSNEKGLVYLLRAAYFVKKSTRLRCVLIGDGEEYETLQQMAQHLGVADDVLFLGKQQNPFKFMRKATLFVLPSIFEGLPNVLIEALACSCPVIATDCPGGGSAEILKDGEYGLLVPPRNGEALSDAILRLLQDHELREKLSTRGSKRARDFDLGTSLKAYEDIILAD